MQAYPNYYSNQTPMYQQNYSQMPVQQNPYMDRLNSLQQYQQALQQQSAQPMQSQQIQPQPMINGRVIDDISVVTANEVPMDGTASIFPKRDMSEIYMKSWNADGTIRTVVFKPVSDEQPELSSKGKQSMIISLSDENISAFMERFDCLEGQFEELKKSMASA